MKNYIILDLEATCWEKGTRPTRMETIEFGAVRLDAHTLLPSDEFARFVRPIAEPTLSTFCTELTSITQRDVDAAATFPQVWADFLGWTGADDFTLCTWGAYDVRQLKVDCQRHNLPFPAHLESFINVKKRFATWQNIRPCGMKRALDIVNIPLDGTHHRGIDDARNIAKIVALLLQEAVL